MAATWLRFRTELRVRWRGTLALVLLLGFVGSVVLAAAGTRRTSTAPDRLVAAVGGEGDAHVFDVGTGSSPTWPPPFPAGWRSAPGRQRR